MIKGVSEKSNGGFRRHHISKFVKDDLNVLLGLKNITVYVLESVHRLFKRTQRSERGLPHSVKNLAIRRTPLAIFITSHLAQIKSLWDTMSLHWRNLREARFIGTQMCFHHAETDDGTTDQSLINFVPSLKTIVMYGQSSTPRCVGSNLTYC